MAQPMWWENNTTEGVQRTQPRGFSAFVDDTETENEKREKERRVDDIVCLSNHSISDERSRHVYGWPYVRKIWH